MTQTGIHAKNYGFWFGGDVFVPWLLVEVEVLESGREKVLNAVQTLTQGVSFEQIDITTLRAFAKVQKDRCSCKTTEGMNR